MFNKRGIYEASTIYNYTLQLTVLHFKIDSHHLRVVRLGPERLILSGLFGGLLIVLG